MKKILIGIDQSPAARHAFLYVLKVFGQEPMALFLACVVEPSPLQNPEPQVQDFLQELVGNLSPMQRSQIAIEKRVTHGLAGDSLLSLCDDWQPDLLAIGASGDGSAPLGELGRTAHTLISQAACPLLIIPEKTPHVLPRHILYADDARPPQMEVIDHVLYFSKQYDAEVDYLRMDRAKDQMQYFDTTFLQRVYQAEIEIGRLRLDLRQMPDLICGLSDFQHAHHPDILIMQAQKEELILNLFKPSTCRSIHIRTAIPVWIFPSPDAPIRPKTQKRSYFFRP